MKTTRLNKRKAVLLSSVALAGLLVIGTVWALQPKGDKGAAKARPKARKVAKGAKAAKGAKGAEKPEDCKLPESVRKQVVAKIGETTITVGTFADEINKKSPYLRARYESLERRKNLLKSLIRMELLAAEAQRRGLDKDPDVQRTMKQVMIQKLLNKVFEERVKQAGIPPEELKKFYDDHFKEYNKPEQVRISHILLADKSSADSVAAEAKKTGRDMRNWRQLVRKHSTDRTTKIRGGDLRYFDKETNKHPKPLVAAAFKLAKPGEVAGPIKTEKGYHVIRLTHRRKAFKRTFDEVKVQIKQRLLRQKRSQVIKDFVKEIRGKAKINVNEGELAALKVDTRTPIRGVRRGRRRMRFTPPGVGRGRRRRRGGPGGLRYGRGRRRRGPGGPPGSR